MADEARKPGVDADMGEVPASSTAARAQKRRRGRKKAVKPADVAQSPKKSSAAHATVAASPYALPKQAGRKSPKRRHAHSSVATQVSAAGVPSLSAVGGLLSDISRHALHPVRVEELVSVSDRLNQGIESACERVFALDRDLSLIEMLDYRANLHRIARALAQIPASKEREALARSLRFLSMGLRNRIPEEAGAQHTGSSAGVVAASAESTASRRLNAQLDGLELEIGGPVPELNRDVSLPGPGYEKRSAAWVGVSMEAPSRKQLGFVRAKMKDHTKAGFGGGGSPRGDGGGRGMTVESGRDDAVDAVATAVEMGMDDELGSGAVSAVLTDYEGGAVGYDRRADSDTVVEALYRRMQARSPASRISRDAVRIAWEMHQELHFDEATVHLPSLAASHAAADAGDSSSGSEGEGAADEAAAVASPVPGRKTFAYAREAAKKRNAEMMRAMGMRVESVYSEQASGVCFATGKVLPMGMLDLDHFQASAELITRQLELLEGMRKDPRQCEKMLEHRQIEAYVIGARAMRGARGRAASRGMGDDRRAKLVGSKKFFMDYHHCMDSLWLMNRVDNSSEKNADSAIAWLRQNRFYGKTFLDSVKPINKRGVIYTVMQGGREMTLMQAAQQWMCLRYGSSIRRGHKWSVAADGAQRHLMDIRRRRYEAEERGQHGLVRMARVDAAGARVASRMAATLGRTETSRAIGRALSREGLLTSGSESSHSGGSQSLGEGDDAVMQGIVQLAIQHKKGTVASALAEARAVDEAVEHSAASVRADAEGRMTSLGRGSTDAGSQRASSEWVGQASASGSDARVLLRGQGRAEPDVGLPLGPRSGNFER